ncbi:hypothetical protein CN544_19205 [Bacillus toyonensis]|uniref:hypothetical protein n=1 Tax=Bacillus TaxID=1386 RepID=UPI00032D91CF|nr:MULTISPECIES: hypothetical protein [Bacillus]EOP32238.1 hypothetical protein IG5_05749 [Bacillus toyonensis]MCG3797400.1 hypothetical protein [Bacillus toyonensis]MED2616209.1 hypothetical protein [Bacillus toyonensis]MED2842103.1 hypothetical protein [Bacillus toyonensis]PED97579.1 hypothetical protein CON78_26325 [Bacillus toyonensis]
MFKFEMNGLDKLQKDLKNMEKAAKELDGKQSIPFPVLFNNSFMKKYTKFNNIDELFENSAFEVETDEDFAKIPDDEWDKYINEVTDFENWEEMMSKAAGLYTLKKLGF